MHIKKFTSREDGFTLVELLVGTCLLVIFLSALSLVLQFSVQVIGESRVRVMASNIGEERLELIRNLPYDDVGTVGGIPNGLIQQNETVTVGGINFEVFTTVVYVDDPFDGTGSSDPISADYKRVRVNIIWDGLFSSESGLFFLSDASPNGLESDAGGGTFRLTVIDSLGSPVAGANIHIENDTVSPAIDVILTTNQDGEILVPGSPACNECYLMTVTKSGYTTDKTYSTSEVANPNKPYGTIIEGELSSLTFTIDRTSQITFYTTGPRSNNYPPFVGVQFKLKGSKSIGTDVLDQTVLKYDQTLVSSTGGSVKVSGLEPDIYEITIPNPSSIDFAGSSKHSPFTLLPNTSTSIFVVTSPATGNNLLVRLKDLSGNPVATATARIKRVGFVNETTGSAGPIGKGDVGQVLFPGLSSATYVINVSHPDFKDASLSASVSGDSTADLTLEELE